MECVYNMKQAGKGRFSEAQNERLVQLSVTVPTESRAAIAMAEGNRSIIPGCIKFIESREHLLLYLSTHPKRQHMMGKPSAWLLKELRI